MDKRTAGEYLEVGLKRLHFCADFIWFEHCDGCLLEGDVGSSVKVRST